MQMKFNLANWFLIGVDFITLICKTKSYSFRSSFVDIFLKSEQSAQEFFAADIPAQHKNSERIIR